MKEQITRDQANDAKKLDLGDGHYLDIVSVYSDQFRVNRSKIMSAAALLASTSEFTPEIQIQKEAELVAASLVGWKLPKKYGEFNQENASKFLFEHPQLREQVDVYSSNDANYLVKK